MRQGWAVALASCFLDLRAVLRLALGQESVFKGGSLYAQPGAEHRHEVEMHFHRGLRYQWKTICPLPHLAFLDSQAAW